MQLRHIDDPEIEAKVPTAQLVHALAPDAEYVPEPQLKHTVAADAESVPGVHALQRVDPVDAWKVPDAHEVHNDDAVKAVESE